MIKGRRMEKQYRNEFIGKLRWTNSPKADFQLIFLPINLIRNQNLLVVFIDELISFSSLCSME